MLCIECQAIPNSWPESESTREASDGQMAPGLSQGREREQQECSMFEEREHVQNGAGSCHRLPSYKTGQPFFSRFESGPPELTRFCS